jgi:hypothetical protein
MGLHSNETEMFIKATSVRIASPLWSGGIRKSIGDKKERKKKETKMSLHNHKLLSRMRTYDLRAASRELSNIWAVGIFSVHYLFTFFVG